MQAYHSRDVTGSDITCNHKRIRTSQNEIYDPISERNI